MRLKISNDRAAASALQLRANRVQNARGGTEEVNTNE
jgi:hypothetical protein